MVQEQQGSFNNFFSKKSDKRQLAFNFLTTE